MSEMETCSVLAGALAGGASGTGAATSGAPARREPARTETVMLAGNAPSLGQGNRGRRFGRLRRTQGEYLGIFFGHTQDTEKNTDHCVVSAPPAAITNI